MNTKELYESVTNDIIKLMESNLEEHTNSPWVVLGVDNKPAHNPITGNTYQGINQLILSFIMYKKGYLKSQWMTYNQIKSMNGTVLKNSRSVPVIFYKTSYIGKEGAKFQLEAIRSMSSSEIAEKGIESIPTIRLFNVFNVAQTIGLPEEYYAIPEASKAMLTEFDKDQKAEALISDTGATIHYIPGNRAFYNLTTDTINLPIREQFNNSQEAFYNTALHEISHWSGHQSRLDRKTLGNQFGSPEYASEELIAELSASYLCAYLGFTKSMTSNAAYLQSWIKVLKDDPKAIFKASAQAQKASDYIINLANNKKLVTADSMRDELSME